VQVEVKAAEDTTTWGATKRRTLQAKAKEISEAQAISADSQNSSVASNQPAQPGRIKAQARSKVAVKKEKEQTLTSLLTARSEVSHLRLSYPHWLLMKNRPS
jgi:hypothetical protein